MAQSKQYKDNSQKYDRDRLHSDEEAIAIIKSLGTKKFDETIDIVVRLGVDPRKAEQMIRATVALPSGTGKDVRIAVFAQGEAAQAARDAGAEHVGGEELAAEVAKGMTDFDLAIATPDMMPVVGKLGRVLGPRGLMPNPKTGTVTPDVAKAVGEFKGGMVEYRTDRFANVHVPIGKVSFDEAALLLNLRALIAELEKAKPASSKGLYMQKIVLSTTMGPGVRVDPGQVVTS
ncbi:MAG: large subunit ribosomal protein L1 [Candidatus Aldehydirespiratoraceae bacterium]|jgi:large subunit ribosomal protein L1